MTVKTTAYPLKFEPIPQERIWGGEQLKAWFGMENVKGPIGEYWVLSGHPNATSTVLNGALAGRMLTEVVEQYGSEYLGDSPQPRFPLLIKFLEAEDDLSVQVHPDDEYALTHEGDYGKTEAWYILNCRPDSKVVYGHQFPDKTSYQQAVDQGNVEAYFDYSSVKPGQVVFVPSQTLHALLAGIQVIEIQQTSDVTYRVYDWNRVDRQGKGRELHMDQAANVLRYGRDVDRSNYMPISKPLLQAEGMECECLVQCQYFTLEKWTLEPGRYEIQLGKAGSPDILIGVSGTSTLTWTDGELRFEEAQTVLIPTTLHTYILHVLVNLVFLRVTY